MLDSLTMITIKYIFFAAISAVFNLFFQYVSFLVYKGFGDLYIAMFFGTLAGLVSKYILDKKFIFYHTPKNKKDDAKKFMLYSFMGILTTIIFWGTEILFDHFSENEYGKYIGAVLGLSIGYIIKYFLDKKFVFKDSADDNYAKQTKYFTDKQTANEIIKSYIVNVNGINYNVIVSPACDEAS